MDKKELAETILSAIDEFDNTIQAHQQIANERIRVLESEIERLKKQLSQKTSFVDQLSDEELRKRLSGLHSAPFDTQLREAGVIFENRLRLYIGEDAKGKTGAKLVDLAFAPNVGKFQVSDNIAEQSGVLNLYKGAVLFIRNPVMHRLIEYNAQTARTLIRMIDSLLILLDELARGDEVSQQKSVNWTEKRLRQAIETEKDQILSERFKRLLDIAIERKRFAVSSGKTPIFGFLNNRGVRMIAIKLDGYQYFYLSTKNFENESERERVFNQFVKLGLLDSSVKLDEIQQGRYSKRPFSDMTDDEFEQYIQFLENQF